MSRPGGYGGDYRQGNPYAQQDNYGSGPVGYGGNQGGYGQQQQHNAHGNSLLSDYEMNNMDGGGAYDDGGDFYTMVNNIDDGIKQMRENTGAIQVLQKRSLEDIDANHNEIAQRIENATASASEFNRGLSTKIRLLKGKARGDSSKQAQAARVEKNYQDSLMQYQRVVLEHQKALRAQIKRQVKIVKPDATEQELEEACEDGPTQVFSQALLSGAC